jgi:hypothetical protein
MIIEASTERDPHQEYYGVRQNIPVLPPVINGRTYFNKARDRRLAMDQGIATEPIGVIPTLPSAKRNKPYATNKFDKYHWEDSDCVRVRSKHWSPEQKDRVISGSEFNRVMKHERCMMCDSQYNKA